jgi:hypothetical protein
MAVSSACPTLALVHIRIRLRGCLSAIWITSSGMSAFFTAEIQAAVSLACAPALRPIALTDSVFPDSLPITPI